MKSDRMPPSRKREVPAAPVSAPELPAAAEGSRVRRRLPGVGLALLVAAVLLYPAGHLAYTRGPLWLYSLHLVRPPGIVIHHSATPTRVNGEALEADDFDRAHARRGWGFSFAGHQYHIGYHYVVLPDGTVQTGRPEWMPGAHCRRHNNMLGICLVGDFMQGRRPTRAQLQAAEELARKLMRKYRLSPARVHRHRDLGATDCPGESFPWEEFRKGLEG